MDYSGPYLSSIFLFTLLLVLNSIDFASYLDSALLIVTSAPYVVTVTLIASTAVTFQWFLDKQMRGTLMLSTKTEAMQKYV